MPKPHCSPPVSALRGGQELVEIGRRLQVLLRQQIEPHIEVKHDVLQRHVVALAVGRRVQPPKIRGDVALARPAIDPFVERRQRVHLHQARQVVELHHRRVGAVAGDDRRVHPVVVVAAAAPRDVLGLDLDARVFLLERGDQFVRRRFRVVEMVPPAYRHGLLRVRARQWCGGQRRGGAREQTASFHGPPPRPSPRCAGAGLIHRASTGRRSPRTPSPFRTRDACRPGSRPAPRPDRAPAAPPAGCATS